MNIDWNQLIQTVAIAFLPIIAGVFGVWVRSHMKDQEMAAALAGAADKAVGAVQQALQKGESPTQARLAGVEYVKTVAAPAVAYDPAGSTDAIIDAKVGARIGLANVATNQAVAASASPAVPAPLDPVTSVAQVSAKASEQVYSAPPPASLRDLLVGRGSSPDPIPVSTIGDKP